ncbi:hypothetical protein ABI59_07430 [Acidobacteria bacterium Mor1]|nr:hypothetical protein ABI59_07430 [Acidobacteria bacterium Mor1]
MKAVVITGPGGPEKLAFLDVPEPSAGPEEVRVRVRASAMNRADLLQRRGLYPAPAGEPADIPGLEFAGEVESCGERVRTLRPGDRVMGIVGGGGHAEKVVLHERLCLEVPPCLSWSEAAAVPEAFLTAFDALLDRGRLIPGESLLIHAAGSGVGTAALQLGLVSGARVVALSRSEDKRRRLQGMGAGTVLDPSHPQIAQELQIAAGPQGIDVVLDSIGAAAWELNMSVLAELGRIVIVGLLGGTRTEVHLGQLLARRASVVGTVLRTRPLEQRMDLVQRFAKQMLPLLAEGRLRAVVDSELPLHDAAEAHRRMENNANFGKIVLTVGSP